MNSIQYIIDKLEQNRAVFKELLRNCSSEEYRWKPQPEKWCLLEILCHLRDEEIEDFRTRVRCTLSTPAIAPPPIDPEAWVSERKYLEQDYQQVLENLLQERDSSIQWLRALDHPQWDNFYLHPRMGEISAARFLANWLAHDHLHMRQIIHLRQQYLAHISGEDLSYAGNW